MTEAARAVFLNRASPPHISTLILLPGLSAAAMNMFLPSLNHMAESFGVSYAFMQLSVPLYLGFSGILQMLIGPISDRYGRRNVMLAGLGVFLIFTLGCIVAPTAEIFLICRAMQATVAVAMVVSRAAVRDMYDQDKAASMIGYVTMGMAVVPMVAPFFGGLLDEAFGWRSIFWVLLGTGAVIFWMTWADMGETAIASGKTLREQFREYPELLRSQRFWGYSLSCAFSSGAFFSYLGGAPFVGSEIFGLSPARIGLYLGAPAIGYAFGNYLTGMLAERLGINRLILWGCIANVTGIFISLVLFLMGMGSALVFFGFMTFVGFGNGLTIPNSTAGMLSVRPRLAGTASGLGGALMIGGGAALSALAGSLLTVETGAFPLLWLQFATGVAANVAILWVYWRERQLRGV